MPDQKHKTAIASDTRRSQRVRIAARARFREVGANPYEVEIDDLSATGFRMISYTPAVAAEGAQSGLIFASAALSR